MYNTSQNKRTYCSLEENFKVTYQSVFKNVQIFRLNTFLRQTITLIDYTYLKKMFNLFQVEVAD